MVFRRAAMLGCAILLAATVAGPAMAVPPVLAPPAAQALVANYMAAIRSNDLAAYAALFAPDARIVSDWPAGAGRDAWLKAVSAEFAPPRVTRFLAVFSRSAELAGTRVLLVQQIEDCRPGIVECFAQFRSETLTVQNGLIVALERSQYSHRLAEPGGWTFDAP